MLVSLLPRRGVPELLGPFCAGHRAFTTAGGDLILRTEARGSDIPASCSHPTNDQPGQLFFHRPCLQAQSAANPVGPVDPLGDSYRASIWLRRYTLAVGS